jgi:hypothetical protein
MMGYFNFAVGNSNIFTTSMELPGSFSVGQKNDPIAEPTTEFEWKDDINPMAAPLNAAGVPPRFRRDTRGITYNASGLRSTQNE